MKTLAKPDAPPAADLDRIREMDTPALRAELASALGLTARHLLHLATVWAELERRGEDLSDLRSGIGTYLPLIASGAVLPETVVRFAGQPAILRAVAGLPVDEQRRLAITGESVPLVVRQGDTFTHRMLPVHALTAAQARQVFGERRVRTETEQIALLTPSGRAPKLGKPPKRGKLRADPAKGVVRVGHSPIPIADLVAALGDARSPDTAGEEPGDDAKAVLIKLTPAEHKTLAQRALDGDTSMTALARNALRAAGLI